MAYAHRGDGAGVPCVTERAWQRTVLDAAGYLGWRCYHPYDSRRSEKGFPDAFCVREGSGALVFEFKTERGRIRPEQHEWLALMNSVSGIRALVARPADWDEIEQLLRGES